MSKPTMAYLPPKVENKNLHARVPKDLFERLQVLSEKLGISQQDLIIAMLKKGVEEMK